MVAAAAVAAAAAAAVEEGGTGRRAMMMRSSAHVLYAWRSTRRGNNFVRFHGKERVLAISPSAPLLL